ncbi:AAA family ATPase [Haladaptatus sp. NG-WS-4]
MSEFSNGNETITRSENGITVEKSFDGDEFAVPAVRFELRSDREEEVTVRITDRIPEDFPMDNVGFHPDYENENWTAYKDHRVQFERTLDPNEQLTTVYGIRLSDGQDAEEFLLEPELEEVTPVSSDVETEQPMEEHTITDIVSEDSSQVVRDVIAGDSPLPGLDDEEVRNPLADASDGSFGDEEPTETEDISAASGDEEPTIPNDDVDESGSVLDPPAESDATESTEQPAPPPRPGSVAAALADEIRAGEVDETDLRLIQQELDLDTPESTNVRIRHLQSRVDDLSAYTEALEEFINDNGTAQSIIAEFETEVETVRDELGDVHADIETTKDESAQARARVADLENNLTDLETELDELREFGSDLDVLESQLDNLEDLVAANTEEANELNDEIAELRDDVADVREVEDELETLSDEVSDLSESVSATETRLDGKIDTLRSDVKDVENELTELREWREQLGSVFGGN